MDKTYLHPAFGENAKSNVVPLLDSSIHWIEGGSGDPIVMMHGNPSSSFLWRKVLKDVPKLNFAAIEELSAWADK